MVLYFSSVMKVAFVILHHYALHYVANPPVIGESNPFKKIVAI